MAKRRTGDVKRTSSEDEEEVEGEDVLVAEDEDERERERVSEGMMRKVRGQNQTSPALTLDSPRPCPRRAAQEEVEVKEELHEEVERDKNDELKRWRRMEVDCAGR